MSIHAFGVRFGREFRDGHEDRWTQPDHRVYANARVLAIANRTLMSTKEVNTKIAAWLNELSRQLNHENWPEVLEEIGELEQENPLLLDRQFMADWMTMFFVQAIRERNQSQNSTEINESTIRRFLLHHSRPLVAGARLCLILDHLADPDLVIEETLQQLPDESTPVQ